MKAIFTMEIIKNAKDKGLYFWTFALPIIFTVLFISIFTSGSDAEMKEQVIISIVPGYTVMFLFFIIVSMGYSFIEDRDKGMVARLASTPLSPFAYLLGKWTPYILIVLIQIAALLLFGKIAYNISVEQPFLLSILAIVLTFCVTGIGLAISLTIQTGNMGVAITQVIALGGALSGGLWMPFELMPRFFQKIGKFTPQYWAHDAFKGAMTGTLSFSSFTLSILILFGIGCISFTIALATYRAFLKRAKS